MGRKLLVVLISLLLSACMAVREESASGTAVRLSDLAEQLSETFKDAEPLPRETAIDLFRLDPETTKSVFVSAAGDGSAQMIAAVESTGPDEALKCTEKLRWYAETLKNTAGLYSPEQLPLLENAWTYTRGCYSFLIISSSLEDLKASLMLALNPS